MMLSLFLSFKPTIISPFCPWIVSSSPSASSASGCKHRQLYRTLHYVHFCTFECQSLLVQAMKIHFFFLSGLQFQISNSNTRLHSSESIEVKKGSPFIHITMDQCIPLEGDVKVEFSHKPKMMLKVRKTINNKIAPLIQDDRFVKS